MGVGPQALTALPPQIADVLEKARHRAALWRDEPSYRAAVRGRVMRPLRVHRFASFGAATILHKPAWVYGPHKIAIGHHTMIMEGAWLSAERMTWDAPGPSIVIGNRVAVRAWATISASSGVDIGDDVVFGAQCTVVDCDHTWRAGVANVLHNPVVTEPIVIGAGTWLGDRVTVLRGAHIGERCAIGAHSVVRGEIPDGSIAVGIPAKVVGRSEDL
jgi:acetyltransferase-like isoleucine patch superfamily enzyme